MPRGWAIFDGNRQYINLIFETEQQARVELRDLLAPYPPGHEWRARLTIELAGDQPLTMPGDPPYGYQHQPDPRNGTQLIRCPYERKIIRKAVHLQELGYNLVEVARKLNNNNRMRPRYGEHFTALQIDELLQQWRRHEQREETRRTVEQPAREAGT